MRIFSEKIIKRNVSDSLGVGVAIEDGRFVKVSMLGERHKFSSRVTHGIYMLSINNVSINGWTHEQVIAHLKSLAGTITFVFCDQPLTASHTHVVTFSSNLFQYTHEEDNIDENKNNDDEDFVDVEDEDDVDEIILCRSAMTEGERAPLVTVRPPPTEPEPMTSIGVQLESSQTEEGVASGGFVTIANIDEESPFALHLADQVQTGMAILAINGMSCLGLPAQTVLSNLEAHCLQALTNKPEKQIELVLGTIIAVDEKEQPSKKKIEGGKVWGKYKYRGTVTNVVGFLGCLAGGLPGLCVCYCCPLDVMDAYIDDSNGGVYNASGDFIGAWDDELDSFVANTSTTQS